MARTRAERIGDARKALATFVDVWVATASVSGKPHLVPLSFASDGAVVVAATPASSATARNVCATGRARLGFGDLRDVVMVDAVAASVPWEAAETGYVALFVGSRGWNPADEPYEFAMLAFRPTRIQVWQNLEEIRGRDVMLDGEWLRADALDA